MTRFTRKTFVSTLITNTLFIAATVTTTAQAGGIGLGATRIIYPQGDKQISLPVTNTSESNVFLVQSWVTNADQSKSSDFIITPPLFVMILRKKTPCVSCMSVLIYQQTEKVFFISTVKQYPLWIKVSCKGIRCKLPRKVSLSFLFDLKSCQHFQLMPPKPCAAR